MPLLCDTHCHLFMDDFSQDLDEVVQRAVEAGVGKILVPGIDLETSRKAIELADRYPGLIAPAVGIHPNHSGGIVDDNIAALEKLIRTTSNVRALGEIGLDLYRTWSSFEDQVFVFTKMLHLAGQYNLPVCLHVRESAAEIIRVLDDWYADLYNTHHPLSQNPGVFHAFDGSDLILRWGMDHNFVFGIGGMVSYPKSSALRDQLLEIGPDRMILETDSPFLAPQPFRGKRNEPAYVKCVADEISKITGQPLETILQWTERNAERLFLWQLG